MSRSCSGPEVQRIQEIARELEVEEVAESLNDQVADVEAVQEIGRRLLKTLEQRLESLPPPLPEAQSRWQGIEPKLGTLARLQYRELDHLRQLEEQALETVLPHLGALPDLLWVRCRRELRKAQHSSPPEGESVSQRARRLMRLTADQLASVGVEFLTPALLRLREHLLAAIGFLYPLALTQELLWRELRKTTGSEGEEPVSSLRSRLGEWRDRWPTDLDAERSPTQPAAVRERLSVELGNLLSASGILRLGDRVHALSADLDATTGSAAKELEEACLGAFRDLLEDERTDLRQLAEEAFRTHARISFDTLAQQLDQWLDDCHSELQHRCGLVVEPRRSLRVMSHEIEDICRLSGAPAS